MGAGMPRRCFDWSLPQLRAHATVYLRLRERYLLAFQKERFILYDICGLVVVKFLYRTTGGGKRNGCHNSHRNAKSHAEIISFHFLAQASALANSCAISSGGRRFSVSLI